jgi:hypothetical protein
MSFGAYMGNSFLLKISLLCITAFQVENFALAQTPKEQLIEILKNRSFEKDLVKDRKKNTTFQGNKFAVDETGIFYKEGQQGQKYPLEIYGTYGAKPSRDELIIFDPHKPPMSELPVNPWAVPRNKDFNDIVFTHRLFGIFTIKTKNPECYLAYAAERLGPAAYLDRLLALERPQNPRPLVFASDEDWEDFKKDIKTLFSPFKGKDSFVVILGTSTSFFSENPRKGKNTVLFESAPECIARAKDPVRSLEVYTFDTPGQEKSDLDFHILIPELSALCHNASVLGNDGQRDVYVENTLDKCLSFSPDERVRNLVIPTVGNVNTLKAASPPDKPFGQFLNKWAIKFNNRPINFSVVIRPDHRKGDLFRPENNFSHESHIKRRFVIPID